MTEDTKATASPLDDLLAAKEHSDKGDYGSKTHLVRNLLHKFPKDFVVDTPEGQFVGITHVPTGFKMHISRAVVPLELFKNQREILKSQNDIVKAKRDMMSPQLEALKEQQKQEQEAVKAQQKQVEQAVQQEQEQLKKEEGKRRHAAAVNAFTTAFDRSNETEDDLEKSASDKPRHELIIGPSGAGKTTLAKALAEQTGMPVINLDKADPKWREFVMANDNLRNEDNIPLHLIEGTKTNKQWKKLMRSMVEAALAMKEPHIIEGTHLMTLTPEELKNHNLHVINPSKDEVINRREARMRQKEISKGYKPGTHYKPEDYENSRIFAEAFYDKIQPTIKEWESLNAKVASAQVLQAAGVPVKDPTEILPGGRMDASEDITAKPKDPNIPTTGPAAIAYRLKNLDLAAIEQKQRDLIKSGKVSKRSNAVKTLNILEGFKRNNLTGADLTITKVPVIPPVFRPFRMAGSTFVPGDANELYRDLFTMKKLHKEVADELGDENSGDARMGIYNAVKAVYGFGDPVNPKTASRGVTGFFKKVTGTNPKYCYDSETEILTRKYGWVFFKDLTEDTEVATLNPETGAFEWQMPDAYVHAPFEGEMVKLSVGYRVDLLVTPNHRMWLRTRIGRMKEALTDSTIIEGWEIEKAWRTANRSGRYWLQTAARNWKGNSVLPECAQGFGDVNLFAEWLGWWMAEGSIHSDGGILHIWQTKANMTYCEELDELMRKMITAGLPCSKGEHKRDGETIGWVWSLKKCRPLCDWLTAYGGVSCNTKTIPKEVLDWDKPQLELFLKSYLKGDGSKRTLDVRRNGGQTHKFRNPFTDSHVGFVTTSKALFDAITEVGIKIGVTIYRRKSYPHLHPADRSETFIGSLVGKWNCVTEGNDADFVPYSGEVHCCSVPNGLLFVRRNGKTVVSGNSFVQRQLLSKPQDTVSRGTITINPDLTMNQVGVPKDMAWKMYSSYVQRRLVNLGYSPGDAVKAIKDQNDDANRALQMEVKERPVIVSRAPAWHKFNAVAAHPVLVDGNTVEINPFITTGMNADFDGDAMNVHVPASDEAVKEAYEKLLPSKMLFTIRDPDKVMPNLKHEQILSLYGAVKRPATKKWKFNSEAEALRAIKAGDISLSDEVEYPGLT